MLKSHLDGLPLGKVTNLFQNLGCLSAVRTLGPNHNPQIKFVIIQCLTKCNIAICTERHKELDLLKNGLVANGYPEKELIKASRRPSERRCNR